MPFNDIVADFDFLDDWEERYKYLIDLGRQLPPLSPTEQNDAHKVRGCASQVWLVFDETTPDKISFRGDSDAYIVKGLVALLVALFSGKSPAEIAKISATKELARLDLADHITPQRSNGLTAMVTRVQKTAERALATH